MNEPTPWKESAPDDAAPLSLEREAGRLMERLGEGEPWPPNAKARLWEEIEGEIQGGRPRWPLWAVPLAAAGVLATVLLLKLPSPEATSTSVLRTLSIGGIGVLEIAASAQVDIPSDLATRRGERQIRLTSGRVGAHIEPQRAGDSFVIATPQLKVVVVGTRFSVEASARQTEVEVKEGLVRVESESGSVLLRAGERITSADARLAPKEKVVARPCSDEPTTALRRACYEGLARGEGLAAQNALYALGLLAKNEEQSPPRALEHWAEYEARFPRGALAPEVSLGMLETLVSDHDGSRGLARASAFLSRFPSHSKAADVALIRADLLCQEPGSVAMARKAYQALWAAGNAVAVQERALWAAAQCEASRRDAPALKASLRRYLRRFPSGPHGAQAQTDLKRLARE